MNPTTIESLRHLSTIPGKIQHLLAAIEALGLSVCERTRRVSTDEHAVGEIATERDGLFKLSLNETALEKAGEAFQEISQDMGDKFNFALFALKPRYIAIHEAGHALGALLQGITVCSASIAPEAEVQTDPNPLNARSFE